MSKRARSYPRSRKLRGLKPRSGPPSSGRSSGADRCAAPDLVIAPASPVPAPATNDSKRDTAVALEHAATPERVTVPDRGPDAWPSFGDTWAADEPARPTGSPADPAGVTEPTAAAPADDATVEPPAGDSHPGHDDAAQPDRASLSELSAEFFRMEEESVPPFVEVGDQDALASAPCPRAVARRARFRRVIGAIVGFAAVVSVVAVGKVVVSRRPVAPTPYRAVPARVAAGALEAAKQEAVAVPARASSAPTSEVARTEPPDSKPAPADADIPEAGPAPTEVDPSAPQAMSEADIKHLKKEAERLLNMGKRAEAIEAAKKAIAADPNDALPYLLLGSALQDSGKWKEGIEAYSECVRRATRGNTYECRAFGGRK